MSEERERETKLEDLVHECLDRLEEDGPGALEHLCSLHPELAEGLRIRMAALDAAGMLGSGAVWEEALPATFGEFTLLKKLGAGGMGVVHLASQEALQRRVALKRIHPGELHFGGSRERFEREALAIASLSHPGIAMLYEASEEAGVPFLVMEYVPGISLAEVVKRFAGRSADSLGAEDLRALLSEEFENSALDLGVHGNWSQVCAALIRQVAHALEHAHQRGVIHRDVKPSNILLSAEDGRAKLVDFGLAGFQGAARVTRTGARLGSLPYAPPERLADSPVRAGPLEDVYSLGATLVEIATLQTPFLAASTEATMKNVVEGTPNVPTSSLPKDLAAICARAMDRNPAARYSSCAAFARDLSRFLEGTPTKARPLGVWKRAARWARRQPAKATGALALVVILVAGPVSWNLVQARLLREERQHSADLRAIATSLFTEVHDEIRDLHGSIEVRRRLVEVGMSYLEKVRRGARTDPGLRANLAQGLMRAGDVFGHPGQPNLGEPKRARECYEEAARLWADLGAEQPERSDWTLFETRAHVHAAAVERLTGDFDRSRACLDRAESLLESLLALNSSDPNVRVLELQILMDRAEERLHSGGSKSSEKLIERAGQLAREVLESGLYDQNWADAAGRADSLSIDRAHRSGGIEAGLIVVEQQRENLLGLLERDADSQFVRPRLIELDRLAGRWYAEANRWEDALQHVNRAIETAEGSSLAGEIWNEAALIHIYREDEEAARNALNQADQLHELGRLQHDRKLRLGIVRTLELRGRLEFSMTEDFGRAATFLEQAIRSLLSLLGEYPLDSHLLDRCSEIQVCLGHVHLAHASTATEQASELGGLRAARNAFREALASLKAIRSSAPQQEKRSHRMKVITSDIDNCTKWIAAFD